MHFLLPLLPLLSGAVLAATVDHPLVKRAECGSGIGSCPSGMCCSESGWCGTSAEHCGGSSCQIDFSDSCDTVIPPPGDSTESIPRPRVGNVPYGINIRQCTQPNTMALTFDDGPYDYTSQILDILDDLGVQATFFVAGNNIGKGRIDDPDTPWPGLLRRMYGAGHHIASHSWTHRNLNQVDGAIQETEIIFNEMALRNLFGWIPTYFRAPFLECSEASGCQGLLASLGYHLIHISIDTKDYQFDSPEAIQNAKDRFLAGIAQGVGGGGHITLAHDTRLQTVSNLTEFMVEESLARGFRLVTVGECLNDPEENWYRTAGGGGSNPAPSPSSSSSSASSTSTTSSPGPSLVVSPDQTCGGTTGYTCQGSSFGNCCSWYGYCGSSSSHCGTGCDSAAGSCTPKPPGISDTTNGLCGGSFQATCANFQGKPCCSAHGFCGSSAAHCSVGCQSGFGQCD